MALVAALVCGPAGAGQAQPGAPAPAPNDAQVTQAKDLVNKAIAKSQAGDHAAAIELYLQAYNIAPLPLLLSNLAAEYQQAQKPIEALKYFCKYLEIEPTGPNVSYATAQARVLQTQLHNPVDDSKVCKPAAPPPPPPPPALGSAVGQSTLPPDPPPHRDDRDPGRGLERSGIVFGVAGAVFVGLGVFYGAKAQSRTDEVNNNGSNQWSDTILADEAEGQSDENKQIGFLIAGGVFLGVATAVYVIGHRRSVDHAGDHAANRAGDHAPHAGEATHAQLSVVPTAAAGYGGVTLVGRW